MAQKKTFLVFLVFLVVIYVFLIPKSQKYSGPQWRDDPMIEGKPAISVKFYPNPLRLSGKEEVTVYIEDAFGNVSKIIPSTIFINEAIRALPAPTEIGDNDKDGRPDLMVKFPREEIIGLFKDRQLPADFVVEVSWSGEIGGRVIGRDTIRVI